MKLAGRKALVTGAGGGIGRATAIALAAEGARVWLADIDVDGVSAVAKHIGKAAQPVQMDVSDNAAIVQAVDAVDREAEGIDLLVNAAGTYALQPWLEIDADVWDRVFAINTRGMMLTLQAVARSMIAHGKGGSIINVASAAGRRGDPNSVAYSASKAAAISITQSAALGLAPYGIRVNAIAPGPVDTAMWADVVRLRSERGDHSARQMVARLPLGRISTAEEQAQAVVFLASADSSYVSGQTLNVDGGLFPS